MNPKKIVSAYNEAGRAVAACYLNYEVDLFTLTPEPDNDRGAFKYLDDTDLEWRSLIGGYYSAPMRKGEQGLIIVNAGLLAIARHNPNLCDETKGSDFYNDNLLLVRFAQFMSETDEERDALLQLAEVRADKILDDNWPFVEIVANQLLKEDTITSPQLKEAYQKYLLNKSRH